MEKVDEVFQKTDLRMEDLHKGLNSLSDMREKAESLTMKPNACYDGDRNLSLNKLVVLMITLTHSKDDSEKFEGVLDSLNRSF